MEDGEEIINFFIRYNDIDNVKKNLTNENILYGDYFTPLTFSIYLNRTEITKFILQYAENNNIKLNLYEALLFSISNNRESICLLLLEMFDKKNLDINLNSEYSDDKFKSNEMNVLFYAIYKNASVEILKILLINISKSSKPYQLGHNVNINWVNKNEQTILHFLFCKDNIYLRESNRINILKYLLE